MKQKTFRQAIVVVHGMGEQRPNDILYQFVDAALGGCNVDGNVERTIVNRPDKISNSYDSRRVQVVDEEKDTHDNTVARVVTEFYEYHWSHVMSGNKLVHLLPLAKRFFRNPFGFGRLTPIVVALLILVALGAYFVYWIVQAGSGFETNQILAAVGLGGIALFLSAQLVNLAKSQIVNLALIQYLADVARYLDPAPDNQIIRDGIRQGLVELLDTLQSKGRHQRIIVAAHSLGSIISYDAISYLWARKNKLHRIRKRLPVFDDLKELAAKSRELDALCPEDDRYDAELNDSRDAYRDIQVPAWIEKRASGNPWLITDFLTFGSPLAHAHILMAHGREDLIDRKQIARGEMSRCPPIDNKGDASDGVHFAWDNTHGYPILHYAAPFSLVKWTNFYFRRDLFAGPIGPNFGFGIKDVELWKYKGWASFWLVCHTRYFKKNKSDSEVGYITELQDEVDLWPTEELRNAPRSMKFDKETQGDPGSW